MSDLVVPVVEPLVDPKTGRYFTDEERVDAYGMVRSKFRLEWPPKETA